MINPEIKKKKIKLPTDFCVTTIILLSEYDQIYLLDYNSPNECRNIFMRRKKHQIYIQIYLLEKTTNIWVNKYIRQKYSNIIEYPNICYTL